ncbi:DUF4349 domain-containing protein [Nocardia sp. 004]|uniref:DUF4349 domain-containing protein n=1 Tax=Nocardia sp. 004 TaxID=3385978 RepID=UPI0039A15927
MRKLAVLCVGVLGLIMLTGCGSDNTRSMPDRSPGIATESAPGPPGLREQDLPMRENNPSGSTAAERKEVVTGSVEITADAPITAAGVVIDRVREVDGRIDSRTEQPGTGDSAPSATLVIRLPADKTEAFIAGLGGVGRVTRISTHRDDVTMQWEDLDARITALQASVDRLRALMAGATTTSDLIDAEEALSARQGKLDSLTAQRRHLDDQIALSTLTIDITASDTNPGDPDNFWDGIVSGWNSLVDWLQDAVVFSGKAIPWLGFLAASAAVLWGIVRWVPRWRKPAPGAGESVAATEKPSAGTGPGAVGAGGTEGVKTSTGDKGAEGSASEDHTEQP